MAKHNDKSELEENDMVCMSSTTFSLILVFVMGAGALLGALAVY